MLSTLSRTIAETHFVIIGKLIPIILAASADVRHRWTGAKRSRLISLEDVEMANAFFIRRLAVGKFVGFCLINQTKNRLQTVQHPLFLNIDDVTM